MWTAEELEAMRLADEEIEAEFRLTNDDLAFSREIAAQQKAYREANREKVAAQQKAYYEANREKHKAYMREYRKRKRAQRDGHPD